MSLIGVVIKQSILNRIKELGGNIDNVKGISLKDDFKSIFFETVLYPKPVDTAWETKNKAEPIFGIGAYIDEHIELLHSNKIEFYNNLIRHYFQDTKEGCGQTFFKNELFTPFQEGTADYAEWSGEWKEESFKKVIVGTEMELMFIGFSYGYPDNLFICLTDPNQDNPTVYGTDHEEYFDEIAVEKTLEEYFNSFLTKDELLDDIKRFLFKYKPELNS